MKAGAERPMSEAALDRMLKAIADPVRRRILRLLKQTGCCAIGRTEGMCACDIEGQAGVSQPTVSHHMGILREAGLVQAEKVGQWRWYRRNEQVLGRLARALGGEL